MSRPRVGPAHDRRAAIALCVLPGLALLLAGIAALARASGVGDVVARLGPLMVHATPLRAGPSGMLAGTLRVSTSGQPSDQLDAAIAAGGAAAWLYHARVSLGEIPDLLSCGGDAPPPGVVDRWLHYGPLLIPGRLGGPSPPAEATLILRPVTVTAGERLAITLYFTRAGPVTLRLPIER